jgi:hypothetical protein
VGATFAVVDQLRLRGLKDFENALSDDEVLGLPFEMSYDGERRPLPDPKKLLMVFKATAHGLAKLAGVNPNRSRGRRGRPKGGASHWRLRQFTAQFWFTVDENGGWLSLSTKQGRVSGSLLTALDFLKREWL